MSRLDGLIYILRMIVSGKDSSHVLNVWIKSQLTRRGKKGGNRSEIRQIHLQFRQIHLAIWTNTFSNLYKYICNLDKYICNLDKYICNLDKYILNVWIKSQHPEKPERLGAFDIQSQAIFIFTFMIYQSLPDFKRALNIEIKIGKSVNYSFGRFL